MEVAGANPDSRFRSIENAHCASRHRFGVAQLFSLGALAYAKYRPTISLHLGFCRRVGFACRACLSGHSPVRFRTLVFLLRHSYFVAAFRHVRSLRAGFAGASDYSLWLTRLVCRSFVLLHHFCRCVTIRWFVCFRILHEQPCPHIGILFRDSSHRLSKLET